MTYTVVIMREDDGRYTAFAPALNDCASFGDTREEALLMVADAMSLYVETLREHGWPVPNDNPHVSVDMTESTDVHICRVPVREAALVA